MRTLTNRAYAATSTLALATALAFHGPASAQAFQGTGSPQVAGSATITTPNGSTTNIAVNNPQTVITWTPFDNTGTAPISFQAGGTTATFTGTSNFSVLNRIISNDASRRVDMFGTVNSQICSTACSTGGNVYFYTPGGFLLGGTAQFNVGSLVLSASPIAFNATTGAFITGPRNEVSFGQALTPGAAIVTNTGSQVNALGTNSYVAFVAPSITRTGNITVGGQAAMVAAEAATIRFAPDGLFDIEVTSGTSATTAMTGGGDITGPASTGLGDNNRIYMVAVPKNQAMTMALSQGSDLGFDVAGVASISGNTIVLSAGHNVTNGQIDTARAALGGTGTSSINLNGSSATSALIARATHNIDLFTQANQSATYSGDVVLEAPNHVWVSAIGDGTIGASLNFSRSLVMDSSRYAAAGASVTGGEASLYAGQLGSVTVDGNVSLIADGIGGNTSAAGVNAGSGTGGTAKIQAEGSGTITLNSHVDVSADGKGGSAIGEGANGGAGSGGVARIVAFGGNNVLAIGLSATVSADGTGGNGQVDGCVTCSGVGGAGTGGEASIYTGSGTNSLIVSGFAEITANGFGGDGDFAGGIGKGGGDFAIGTYGATATFGTSSTLLFDSDLYVQSRGEGGTSGSGTGGAGTGGRATTGSASTDGGSMQVDGNLTINVDGLGGGGDLQGGVGRGGVSDNGGAAGSYDIIGNYSASASAFGGSSASGAGGDAYGGRTWLQAFGAGISVGGLSAVNTSASGGGGQVLGGFADGGDSYLIANNGGTLTLSNDAFLYANAVGGQASAGDGGNAQGGLSQVNANNGTLSIEGNVYAQADGQGGAGGGAGNISGNGTGGTATLLALNGGSLDIAGLATVLADGRGGLDSNGNLAASGDGFGGFARVNATGTGSTLGVTGNLFVSADGDGGSGGECFSCGGAAGDGTGGLAEILSAGSGTTITLSSATVQANGTGSVGTVGVGGDGTGGRAFFIANNAAQSTVNGNLTVRSDGRGGSDFGGFGGGDGFGGGYNGGIGIAQVGTFGGITGSSITVTGTTQVSADGYGGNAFQVGGVTGGDGFGGRARITAGTGAMTLGDLLLNAQGEGGDTSAGTGGTGTGGSAYLSANGANITINGTFATVSVNGTGGDGTFGGSGFGGGDPLTGTGGAMAYANGLGTLQINGNLSVLGRGRGGSGSGGNATGGVARLYAENDGDLNVTARTRIDTDGFASLGGVGRGGYSAIVARTAGDVRLLEVNLRADGIGGAGTATLDAGNGFGGTARVDADGIESEIEITQNITGAGTQNNEMLSADGFGGNTFGGGDAKAGTGTGGTLDLRSTNSGEVMLAELANTTAAQVLIRTRGYGGLAMANNTTGGDAVGGIINVFVDNATMKTGIMQLSSYAQGGDTNDLVLNASGGNAVGGQRNITVQSGAVMTTWIAGGISGAVGGAASGTGNAGNGSGGTATLTVNNATLNAIGNTGITTQVSGGVAYGSGVNGNAIGGTTSANISNNAVINVASGALLGISANAFGGSATGVVPPAPPGTGPGGNATGGTATLNLSGSSISGGNFHVIANGIAGNGATGGNATAGAAQVNLNAGTVNVQNMLIEAGSLGGTGAAGNGGNATGGTARIQNNGGTSSITVAASALQVNASADGGNITGASATGGNGTGGFARITSGSGTLTVNASTQIEATGTGGEAPGGSGGTGRGGFAEAYTFGSGSLVFNGSLALNALGIGGDSLNGLGGGAFGGKTGFGASGGTLSVSGDLTMNASALGGLGDIGGDAEALITDDEWLDPQAAVIYANSGGTVTVLGQTSLNASAEGGDGELGAGGNAAAGEVDFNNGGGTITLNGLNIDANAAGGSAGAGGDGGSATGGIVELGFTSQSFNAAGTSSLGNVVITADATGGSGGAGDYGAADVGGAGGAALGGVIGFNGTASGGNLVAGNVILSANATGGAGGAGSDSDGGTGGNGGAGGTATAGFIQAGTISQSNYTGAGGGFSVGDLAIDASAYGGDGGVGGSTGGGTDGIGGNGGNATGSSVLFLIRGVAASAGAVTLRSDATGGNGGDSSVASGNGGNAKTGIVQVESKDRFGFPAQRGTLTADSIVANSSAVGGDGEIGGTSTLTGGSFFRVLNGDATIGYVSFDLTGENFDATNGANVVSVRDGTADIENFTFLTDGQLVLDASNGAMIASNITLSADTFVANAASVPVPTSPGRYEAVAFGISSAGDFVTNANLDSAQNLLIDVPGAITAANMSSENSISLNSGLATTVGNLDAGFAISIYSLDNVTAGNLTAGGNIWIVGSGSVSLGNLDAVFDINAASGEDLLVLDAVSGETIVLSAAGGVEFGPGGSITAGDLTAGDRVYVDAAQSVTTGNLSAGLVNPSSNELVRYEVYIGAETGITTGSIAAAGEVDVLAYGDNAIVTLGDVTSGSSIGIVAATINGGDMTADGSIDLYAGGAATIDVGDLDGDGIALESIGNINTGSITSASAVDATSYEGSITTGDITASGSVDLRAFSILSTIDVGNVVAGGSVDLTAATIYGGNITADGYIDLYAGGLDTIVVGDLTGDGVYALSTGNVTTGNIVSSADVSVRSYEASVTTQNITAQNGVFLDADANLDFGDVLADNLRFGAGGAVTGGDVVAGGSVFGNAGDTIELGDLTTGATIELVAANAIDLGNVLTTTNLYLASGGNLATGDIVAGDLVIGMADGNMSFGAITTGETGEVYLGDGSMYAAAGGGGIESFFDPDLLLGQAPVASGGSIAIGGPVDTGRFRAVSGTGLTTDAITAASSIETRSGGAASFGDLVAGTTIDLGAMGALTLDSAIAGERIRLGSDIAITGGNVTSGDSIVATSFGDITLGDLSAGLVDPSTASGALMEVAIVTTGKIAVGTIDAVGDVQLAGEDGISAGQIGTNGRAFAVSDGAITLGDLGVDDTMLIGGFAMFDYTGDIDTAFDARPTFESALVAAPGAVTLGAVDAGSFALAVGGNLTLGAVTVDGFLALQSGGDLATGAIDAGDYVELAAVGAVTTGNITAGTSVSIDGGGAVTTGDILAGQGGGVSTMASIGPMDVGPGNSVEIFGESIDTGDITTDGYIGLYAETSIRTDALTAEHDIIALAGTSASFGAITTPERFILAGYSNFDSLGSGDGFDPELIFGSARAATGGGATFRDAVDAGQVEVYAGGPVTATTIVADGSMRIEGGPVTTGALTAGTDIEIRGSGALDIGTAVAGGHFDIDTTSGNILTRAVTANNSIEIAAAAGSVTTGALAAGQGQVVNGGEYNAVVYAGTGSITTGNISARGDIFLAAKDDITAGALSGARVGAFAGDDIALGNIVTPTSGRVQVGNFSMLALGGPLGENYNIGAVFTPDPTLSGGTVSVGNVTTGLFRAAAGESLTAGAVTASTIRARAVGSANVNGQWRAGDIALVSGDIAIGDNGSIDAGANGELLLQAVADGGAVLGDGVTGGGPYKLSNAEFAKLRAGEITIAVGGYGGDADTLIGNLAVSRSNILSADGGLTIATLEESGNALDGTLRVTGSLTATGFGADNYLAIGTQNFELDAVTGLIAITNDANALSGYLEIVADRIHVAQGSLLDQLSDNPSFAGYQLALNTPTTVARPDGVIRAGAIDIAFEGDSATHSLLVQNTGTKAVPAGFTVTDADIGDDGESDLAAGSVDMVINGQIVTPTGTLTGIAVRDLLVSEFGTTAFTTTSTINGCPLTGSCGGAPPPAAIITPTAITVLTSTPVVEASFGNESSISGGGDGDVGGGEAGDGGSGEGEGDGGEGSSPIDAPQPLFDSRPLGSDDDIDDPISGAGNPSLYGASDADSEDEDEDEEDEDGDGKKDRDAKPAAPVGGGQ